MIQSLHIGLDVAQFFKDRDKVADALHSKVVRFDRDNSRDLTLNLEVYETRLKRVVNTTLLKLAPEVMPLVRTEVTSDLSSEGLVTAVFIGLDQETYSLFASNTGVRLAQ